MKARPITTVKTIVTDVKEAGAGIKLFSLADPDQWELPPFRPGVAGLPGSPASSSR